jgi:hypothetical protein
MNMERRKVFMDIPTLGPITKRFADRSTPEAFAFSFFCDECGGEWRSAPRAFVPGKRESPADIRLIRMLWSDQYRSAYEQANLEAIYAFHICPECGRRVCLECFHITEADTAEICLDCRRRKFPISAVP